MGIRVIVEKVIVDDSHGEVVLIKNHGNVYIRQRGADGELNYDLVIIDEGNLADLMSAMSELMEE